MLLSPVMSLPYPFFLHPYDNYRSFCFLICIPRYLWHLRVSGQLQDHQKLEYFMGYFIDFWNMCSIMASTKTKKCHNPHIILLLKRMRVYKNPVQKPFECQARFV